MENENKIFLTTFYCLDEFDSIKYIYHSVKELHPAKCPYCGESYYTELYSISTLVYYPPVYKNEVNINPDRNKSCTTCRCLNCGNEFTY